jgi:hypothetical protein
MAVTAPGIAASGTAVANPTGQNVAVSLLSGTVQAVLVTAPNPPVTATPAVPATTVAATNSNSFQVAVTIAANGATISAVTVTGGGAGGTAAGTYVVQPGGTIAISYTVATPTWSWSALVAGVSGNPIGSLPQNYPVPPGCSVTLIYTVAPTWSWSNPIDIDQVPGYYANNSQAEAAGWNPYTALPYPQHAALAQSGLATGVSN